MIQANSVKILEAVLPIVNAIKKIPRLIRFEFRSSFVKPEKKKFSKTEKISRKRHETTTPGISVFSLPEEVVFSKRTGTHRKKAVSKRCDILLSRPER